MINLLSIPEGTKVRVLSNDWLIGSIAIGDVLTRKAHYLDGSDCVCFSTTIGETEFIGKTTLKHLRFICPATIETKE